MQPALAAGIVNVTTAGAKGDGQIALPSVTIGVGSKALTVGTALFAAADVGKVLILAGAGPAPVSGPVETIPVASPGAGYTGVPSCSVTDASGGGAGAACTALLSLQSVTMAAGGAGCVNGSQTFVVGIDASGTVAQVAATVSGGSVTGSPTIAVRGLLSGLGTVSGAPGYGANCTTAPTFNLSYGIAAIQVTALGGSYSTTRTTAALSGGSPSSAAVVGVPLIGAPVPPLKTTITGYTSPTAVTLNDAAGTAISGVDQILWATNDYTAFQNALNAGSGILVPAGIYWIGGTLDPGTGSTTITGQGMNNTILAFDNGTSTSQDSGNWTPLFENTSGSATAPKGSIQVEDLQFRGLLDFGRVNVGAAGIELNNYTDLEFDRAKFYQVPWMAMQNESIQRFTVTNSVFDTIVRDQARCRSCFAARIIGNKFVHSDDDSIALHQASYVQGPGVVREGLIIEGNDFEDTTGVHILGARSAIIRGNNFRRTKISAINLSWDSNEGINQIRGITVADNIAEDVISRVPFGAAGCVICLTVEPPSSPAGVTSYLPGSAAYPSSYFGLPWNYDLNNVTNATAFSPVSRGVDIHDNMMMRTLPAVSSYSLWGFGRMFSTVGFIDPPVADPGLKPTAGISASANLDGLSVHNNNIHNVRRGIVLNDNVVAPSQASISVSFNNIHDAWEYGVAAFGSGTLATFDLIGNVVDVDPYLISPGRSGAHGAWTQNYGASACFDINYNVIVRMAENTFSDCYSIQTSNTWIMSKNAVRGSVYSGTTGQPNGWSSANYGIGVFPTNVADQFFIEPVTADPTGNPPGSYGVGSVAHYTSSASAPTSGYHVVGDVIWSTAPASCACTGWVALTTGTGWTAGTDYKAQVIQ